MFPGSIRLYNYLFKGNVSCYLVEKYKFSPNCKVVAFTVDGLQSLVGVGATNTETELIVSIVTVLANSVYFIYSEDTDRQGP